MNYDETKVNQGGLMRCCLQSLALWIQEREDDEAVEGTTIGCQYESDPDKPRMVLHGDMWKWVGISDEDAAYERAQRSEAWERQGGGGL